MAISTPLFTSHSRSWQQNRYVYPVISRRSHGLSIGVNLNPDKACNFDCIYCSVDRTIPAPEPVARTIDLDVLRAELDVMLELAASGEIWSLAPFDATPAPLRRLNDVAFSGDGEPTACTQFPAACRLVADLLAWRALDMVKIVVITNATLFDRPEVAKAFAFLDVHNGEIWAKLDAGTQAYYEIVDRSKVPLRKVLDNLIQAGQLRPLVIQSLFMRIAGQSPAAQEVTEYLQRLRELGQAGCQIKLVQVYTVARRTAESQVSAVAAAELDALVAGITGLGLTAEAFYGPL